MGRFVTLAVLLASVLLAGCTGSDEPESRSTISDQLQDLDPAEPVDLSPERRATARDPASVSAALWATDPCALIPDDIESSRIERESPHVCSINYDERAVDVKVGAFFGEGERIDYEPITIAGRRAYEIGDDRNEMLCYIWIPVSPTKSIAVHDIGYYADRISCDLSKRVAAHAVRQIRAGATGPAPTKGRRTSCQVLRVALSDRLGGRRVVYGDHRSSIDSCAAVSTKPPRVDSQFEPPAYAELDLSSEASSDSKPSLRIRGHDVVRRIFEWEPTHNRRCEMEWNEQPRVSVTTRSCPFTRDVVEQVMDEYDRRTPKQANAARLRLYKPGQSDRDAVGACNGYLSSWLVPGDNVDASLLPEGPGCRTYEKVDLPSEPAEILRDAHADPRVTCELARKAVDEHVSKVKPVVLTAVPREVAKPFGIETRPCAFVDDTANRQYLVVASADPLPPTIARNRGGYVSDREADDLRFSPDPKDNWDFGVAAQAFGTSKTDPGYVAVMVNGDRGLDEPGVPNFVSVDDTVTAEAILDSIIDEHFGEPS